MDTEVIFSVSQFVDVFNQTLDYAYPSVVINGELANFRVSKNRWVYFDLKDESSTLKFFGTVYNLPGPLEDGMLLSVVGKPSLHHNYGFSINVMRIELSGEGSLKKSADLLFKQLSNEGLFAPENKRAMPYPPNSIGLITSAQSAAYADFIKVLNQRWGGIDISLVDVQVQGEVAPDQICQAIDIFNSGPQQVDCLVIIRGGGSAEDLAAFSSEKVTRAVATSKIPTLVAIGHEIDISLAELAADFRASTPSNAAELLVPDKQDVKLQLLTQKRLLASSLQTILNEAKNNLRQTKREIGFIVEHISQNTQLNLKNWQHLLNAYDPHLALKRGFAVVRDSSGKVIKTSKQLTQNDIVEVALSKGGFKAKTTEVYYE